jgi:dienelactone hydrolase
VTTASSAQASHNGCVPESATSPMSAADVDYQAHETTMRGRLAIPDGDGPLPGVLIAHEGNGLDEYQRRRADQLGALGYAALALDYHGNGTVYTDHDAMMVRLAALGADPDGTRAIARAGLATLIAQPRVDPSRIAAIGYCFGGTMMLELARSGADLKATIGLHPGLASPRPQDAANITGKVLICVGADDPFIPASDRTAFEAEMNAAGIDWQLHLYGGVRHSFTHPNAANAGNPGLEYHPTAARRAWETTLRLLTETIAEPRTGRGSA